MTWHVDNDDDCHGDDDDYDDDDDDDINDDDEGDAHHRLTSLCMSHPDNLSWAPLA